MTNSPFGILVTESWLAPNSIIYIGRTYNLFRLDWSSPGGGILAYIESDLPGKCLLELEEIGKEGSVLVTTKTF